MAEELQEVILDPAEVEAWAAAARRTAASVKAHTEPTLAAYVRDLGESADSLALFDRNDLDHPCNRRVFLKPSRGATRWTLYGEEGLPLDEPDAGCPLAGFDSANLLQDIDASFYQLASEDACTAAEKAAEAEREREKIREERRRKADEAEGEEQEKDNATTRPERVDPRDVRPERDDLSVLTDGMRVVRDGKRGTLRTREGSGDTCQPANKFMFLEDAGQGRHVL
jgi:hypothetical protein